MNRPLPLPIAAIMVFGLLYLSARTIDAVAEPARPKPVKTMFIPMEPEKNSEAGSFGQTDEGGFVCYGTVKQQPRLTGITNVEYDCQGKKSTLQEHVTTKVGGTYLGATFLYKNPTLIGNRGAYSVGGTRPGISGVVVYYQ